MPRTVPSALLLPALAAVVLSSGCTTTVSGSATAQSGSASSPAAGDTVAWVDQVCGAMIPFIRTATSSPNPDDAQDAATLVGDISNYLGEAVDAAGAAADGLAEVGPSPVEGGDEVVDQLNGTISNFQGAYQEAKSRVESVDIDDRAAVLREVPAAIRELNQLTSMPNPAGDLLGNPELTAAGQQATNCRQIEREFGG